MTEIPNVSAFLGEVHLHLDSLDTLIDRLTAANARATGGEPAAATDLKAQSRADLLTSRMGEAAETFNRLLQRLSHEVDRAERFTGEAPPAAIGAGRVGR